MQSFRHIQRFAYTTLLLCVYIAFLCVHCFTKISYWGASGYATVTVENSTPGTGSTQKATIAKKTIKPNIRLNKRFQPEDHYLVPAGWTVVETAALFTGVIPNFYHNPLQSTTILSACLRAPPAA